MHGPVTPTALSRRAKMRGKKGAFLKKAQGCRNTERQAYTMVVLFVTPSAQAAIISVFKVKSGQQLRKRKKKPK